MSFNLSHCRTVYCLSNWNYNENKTINQENFMNFVAEAIVSVAVLGHLRDSKMAVLGQDSEMAYQNQLIL